MKQYNNEIRYKENIIQNILKFASGRWDVLRIELKANSKLNRDSTVLAI